ncbi:unnamed protein product [Ostreobium quekettii]|uniref:acetyl-CoA C-acyltransferase n=1 Tax=Ostreobium quekettii TaxID=121088 RepID=A0A8S1J577_9CHLO|nr:unnamed protein product [Ostreobium quekettii]|eukprot:evm.model.scf_1257.4 EVM.evm.TU.scf_1257.4   scf_1257:38379-44645(+)
MDSLHQSSRPWCKGQELSQRQCSSGLQAIATVAAAIQSGYYTMGIAGGVETMSLADPPKWQGPLNPRIHTMPETAACLIPMGIMSENVAQRFGVSRTQQDLFSAESHRKAVAAQRAGKFMDEIVPIATKVKHPKTGKLVDVVVSEDDGIRPDTSTAVLAKLPPAFKEGGTTTAGNSSQITDGASAALLMTRREALQRRLPVMGIFRSFVAVGVDPAINGIGPAIAIPAAVRKAGLVVEDIDIFELNEAFASQAAYVVAKLGLDPRKVNPNGGAIALGHPLGSTGSRCAATLLHEMRRRGRAARFGVITMCIGSGMGAAAVFEQGSEADDLNVGAVAEQGHLSRDACV